VILIKEIYKYERSINISYIDIKTEISDINKRNIENEKRENKWKQIGKRKIIQIEDKKKWNKKNKNKRNKWRVWYIYLAYLSKI